MYEHRPARRERGRTDRNARHTDLIQRQKQKSSPPIQPRLLLRDCGLPIPECPLPAYFEKDVPTLRGFLSCRFILLCKQVAYLVRQAAAFGHSAERQFTAADAFNNDFQFFGRIRPFGACKPAELIQRRVKLIKALALPDHADRLARIDTRPAAERTDI